MWILRTNLRPVSPLARLSGRNAENDLLVWQTLWHTGCRFFLRAVHACWAMGDARRSACSSHQRVAHRRSDRSQGNDSAPGDCWCTRRGCEKSRLHLLTRACEEMGKRSRANPFWRVRGDADRLVEALARCSEDGNKDAHGVAHYPGWSLPGLKYLYEDRKITASGHETTDTDSGIATTKDDDSLETYIWARTIIRLSCSRISIKFRNTAQSLWSVFQDLKAAQDFLRGCLRFCPNLTHTLHDINRISCGFARWTRRSRRLRGSCDGDITARSRFAGPK